MVLNPWDVQGKHIHTVDGIASTLYAGMGEGGGKIFILAVFEGNGSRPSHKGLGITTECDTMYTLNSTEVHGVVYELPRQDRPIDGK